MNWKNTIAFVLAALVMGSVFAGFASAAPLPLNVDRVEIDDQELLTTQVNRLDLERGQAYDVEVKFTALADMDNVEIEAFVSGYEYNDLERIVDTTHVFDADAGVTYTKRLEVSFPDDVQEDDYKLRILITDRNNDQTVLNYNLKIDVPRHGMKVEDVYFQPSGVVKAGSALLTTVRVENKGEKDQEDVRVTVSLPTLGVSATEYIEEVETGDDEQETEELFLRLPTCAAPGVYPVNIEIEYDELTRSVSEVSSITVEKNPACDKKEDTEDAEIVALLKQMAEAQAQANKAPVVAPSPQVDGWASARRALEITLLVLVGLLVIVGLILAFSKMNENEDF